MEELIANFGYAAVFLGTLLEGETVLALAGVAAAHGYLSFWTTVGVAVAGAFLGDLAGYALHEWLGKLKHAQMGLLVAIVLAAVVAWMVLRRRSRGGGQVR